MFSFVFFALVRTRSSKWGPWTASKSHGRLNRTEKARFTGGRAGRTNK